MNRRRSIRLPGYDYAQPGAYFITLCAHNRENLFGEIVNAEMILNDLGRIVREEWEKSSAHRAEIELGPFVIMPNHIHAVVIINTLDDSCTGDRPVAPTPDAPTPFAFSPVAPTPDAPTPFDFSPVAPTSNAPTGPSPRSLGAWVGGFKSSVTTRINTLCHTPGQAVWQRNYWEHIIRDEKSYNQIAAYINENPQRWQLDKLYRGIANP